MTRHSGKRVTALVLALVVILFALSGCGNDNQTKATGQQTEAVVKTIPEVSLAPAQENVATEIVLPEETGIVNALSDEQKNSLNMLNYLAYITQEILAKKNSRVYIEQVYSSLINNINPSTVNDYTEAHYPHYKSPADYAVKVPYLMFCFSLVN